MALSNFQGLKELDDSTIQDTIIESKKRII